MKELFNLWVKSVGFDKNNAAQKKDLIVFAITASLTFVFITTWMAIPFGIAAFLSYKKCIKDNCHVDE